MNYSIKKIKIKDNLAIVNELVGELHVSEKEMNDKTADWTLIRNNYLKFMSECEEENDGTFLIAEIDGKAIGFLFGYIDEKDDSNFEQGEGDDLYVSEGYVKKEYRKQGIYSALNKSFEETYSDYKIRKIYRFTLCNNDTMQRWLNSQGYRPVRLVYEKWL
ncbi:GNAT family N-acetyltransferase [Chryseobacterium sp. BIGb0232]|uniref:GNAT family N-acetyltransferase n=1 Tax=Chryseobacterium sp. BIGb0232 TaxID=2940598 RepID=UPI000F482D17|nr:GNAT family N-acetyltransferase [Chryseobacterium sp. BIGb0232]MCS4301804.1 ribosomal protein S18 acetylase RimI-like enzyme [Chryseobacterium sp. BIGb0232]ROS19344.1 acetyltransferase (GNAT) family protein [Chryseobacterium nakagawai]